MNKVLLAAVVAGIACYLLGRYIGPVAREEGEDSRVPLRVRGITGGSVDRPAATSTVTLRTPKQLAALKEDLRGRFSTSPSAAHDWALRAEAAAVLATMSTEEMAGYATDLLGGGGVSWARPDWKQPLVREIFRQWSLKDPAGACLGLMDFPNAPRAEAFADWLRRDPEAAQAWVTRGEFPPGSEQMGVKLRQDFLNHQATTDFSAARESLGLLDADAQRATLLNWSQRLAHDPAKRDELLALVASHGDPEFAQKCSELLVREMAVKSPAEASAFLESTNLPDKQKHALSEEMLGAWATKDPHQAFAAWVALKEDKAPEPLMKAMDIWWGLSGAEEAIEWVNNLDLGPARDQCKARLIGNMSGGQQAADLSVTLDDPTERIRQMKIVKRNWEERDPGAAEAWVGKLSQADRDALGRKLE